MSIEQSIQNEANSSSEEVKIRAHEEEDKRRKQLDNDGLAQDMDERKIYAHRIFVLICMWLFLVAIVFLAEGNGNLHYSDNVIITLLTTTTANVIGLFILVTKYLFNPKH
jgi:hypothetical protein